LEEKWLKKLNYGKIEITKATSSSLGFFILFPLSFARGGAAANPLFE
jgi:hypothetical protein